jgi:hypothetical protein
VRTGASEDRGDRACVLNAIRSAISDNFLPSVRGEREGDDAEGEAKEDASPISASRPHTPSDDQPPRTSLASSSGSSSAMPRLVACRSRGRYTL